LRASHRRGYIKDPRWCKPLSFDPDYVLEYRPPGFWQKGFSALLDEITAASGIAKPSLYAAFGDISRFS